MRELRIEWSCGQTLLLPKEQKNLYIMFQQVLGQNCGFTTSHASHWSSLRAEANVGRVQVFQRVSSNLTLANITMDGTPQAGLGWLWCWHALKPPQLSHSVIQPSRFAMDWQAAATAQWLPAGKAVDVDFNLDGALDRTDLHVEFKKWFAMCTDFEQVILGEFKQMNGEGENFHANYINILQNWNAWPPWIVLDTWTFIIQFGNWTSSGWMCTMMAASSTSSDRRVCWFCRRGLTALSTAWIWIMAWLKLVPAGRTTRWRPVESFLLKWGEFVEMSGKKQLTSIRQESDTQDGLMMFDDFFHMCRIRNVLWPACYIPLANWVPPLSPKDAKVAGFLPIDWDHDGAMDLIIGAWGLSHLKYFQAGWCFLDERAIHMQFTKSLSVYRIY